ncbi:MAG: hypothetical protein ACRYG4_03985, partial [Janthinobacterium lividum]
MPGLGGGAGPSSAAAAQAGRLLPFVVAAIAVYEACIQLVPWVLHPDRWVFPWRIYNLAILAPNYLENGFVRRGLGGTILMLLDGRRTLHPPGSLAAFHLATAIFFALPMALLLRRLAVRGDRQWLWFAVVVLVSPQMFRSWATDVGRTDMLTCGFIAWSLLLALDRRFVLAAVVLFV